MTHPDLIEVSQDGPMSTPGPRKGGPTPRRSYTPAQKLELLTQYDDASTTREGGAFLRENGIYSSQITEWRKLRDAGVLQEKIAGKKTGKLTREQTEIPRLRRCYEDVFGSGVGAIRCGTSVHRGHQVSSHHRH